MKFEEKGIYKILVTECETKDKKKFKSYKIIDNETRKKVDLRFTRDVSRLPEQNCYIVVNRGNINFDNRYEFPRFWVKEIEKEILPEQIGEYLNKV